MELSMNPPTKSPEEPVPIEEMTYEQALSELEAIVLDLESDERSLKQALEMFERGQALARHCAQLLEQAELKIQELSDEGLIDFNQS
jgi:exodeoxyribonuclease VII small subunit